MADHSRNAWVTVLAVAISFAMAFISTGRCLGQSDGALTVNLIPSQDVGVAFPPAMGPSPQYSPQGGAFSVTVTLVAPSGYDIDASSDQSPSGDPSSIWTSSPTTGLVSSQTWQGIGVAGQDDWADVYFNGNLVPIVSGTTGGTNPPFYASVADISVYVDALGTGSPQVSNAEHVAETSEGGGAYLPPGMITAGTAGFPATLPTGSGNYTLIARVKPPQWVSATDADGNVGNLTFSLPDGVAIYDDSYNLVTQPVRVPPSGFQRNFYLLTDENFTSADSIVADFAWTAPDASGTAQDFAHVAPSVTVDHISWQIAGSAWSTSSSLTVALGTTVAFQAFPNPSGASWPSGQPVWGGTSGASGTGGTASVTFSTASSSATDFKTVTATCGNTVTVNVLVVTLDHVTVASGATQTNVTGAKNWAAIKAASGNVVVQAILNPNITNVPDNLVTWTGGNAVAGQPLQRTVPLATSAKTTVTATCGTASDHVDVWILWATITIKMTGTTPANSAQFGALYDGTENLGAITYANGTLAAGKVAPYAVITPAGAGSVVAAGWSFTREAWAHNFVDAAQSPGSWGTTWTNDCSQQKYLRLTPDANDTIYDLDGPTVGQYEHAADSYEVYTNFRQQILWNLNPCSDYAPWYFEGWWKNTETPQITMTQLNTGAITLPGTSGSHYKRVSGTITAGGAGLAGVSVSGGGVTATTAADGTYTLITVPPGNCTITPTLAGYTFTPATQNVTVPSDANVTGQNFTATQP